MEKLEKLTQYEDGSLRGANGKLVSSDEISRRGKMIALVVVSPQNIDSEIEKMAQRGSIVIPKDANAYVASDFSGDTQHIRKNDSGQEKMYSVYAVQFYCHSELPF
jgi:hypothetical protein